ncbi:MAG: hypothetical protein ABFD08_07810 [Syntrophomonas sp.]
MEINSESIREQIPYYLTKSQKEWLVKALKDFQNNQGNVNYYLHAYHDELLQGDGWTKLQMRRFETGEKGTILGIILSNSCDVSSENKRDLPAKITFAPLVPLDRYVKLLELRGINSDLIQAKVKSIKKQAITSLFFLPAGGDLDNDHVALLDELYSMPAKVFESETAKSKVFTLSLFGFYLFIFKISVHFCRFGEDVARN